MIRSVNEYRESVRTRSEGEAFLEQERSALKEAGLNADEIERTLAPAVSLQTSLDWAIQRFEQAIQGNFQDLQNLAGLGRLLIEFRLSNGWHQRQLAERLGVAEAQISRDERNEYRGITIERAQRVLDALDADIVVHVSARKLAAKEDTASRSSAHGGVDFRQQNDDLAKSAGSSQTLRTVNLRSHARPLFGSTVRVARAQTSLTNPSGTASLGESEPEFVLAA